MQEPTFDIWSGTPDKSGKWLETVAGLGNAQRRMKQLAAQTPGKYFIFNVWNSCVLDQIETHEESILALEAKVGGTGGR